MWLTWLSHMALVSPESDVMPDLCIQVLVISVICVMDGYIGQICA